MFLSEPARIAVHRIRWAILAALVFLSAIGIGVWPRSTTRGEAAGAVRRSLRVFNEESPAVNNLDPDLLRALRQAARDAAEYRVVIVVIGQAVLKYGSEEKAARWVATADTSSHVRPRG